MSTLPGSYSLNTPQGTQQINNTQGPINTNFQAISTLFSVNHVGFNVVDNFGTHTVVDYHIQTSDPTTSSTEIAMYSKAVDNVNTMELFYRYPNNGNVVQLTGSTTVTPDNSGSGSGGEVITVGSTSSTAIQYPTYQYLSNGILLVAGYTYSYFPTTSPGSAIFTFPTISGFPQFTQTPFNMGFSLNWEGTGQSNSQSVGEVYITPLSATTFSINYIGNPYPQTVAGVPPYFNWQATFFAIGI